MINFDKIVNKLLKKGGNLFFKEDIFEIIDPEKKEVYQDKLNKVIYRLKAEKIVITMRNGVYLVPDKGDEKLKDIDLIEKYYFKLVKKYITQNCQSDYHISGKKALEIHLKNYAVPEKLYIVNRNTNKKIIIGDYILIFKKVAGSIDGKNINLFSRLSKMTDSIEIDSINFKVANLELSLVENALVLDNSEGVDIDLLNKTMKKYAKYFNKENFYYIGELKFVMAFNRLKELSKGIDKELYELFLDIIKQNGSLFIGEGRRKI